MSDTIKTSHITDHAFEPSLVVRFVTRVISNHEMRIVELPPNPSLCGYQVDDHRTCRMAEAAHRETTMDPTTKP